MTERMSFTDYTNRVLRELYDLDDVEGGFSFNDRHHHDVEKLAAGTDPPLPTHWPREAIEVLRQRGLVTVTPSQRGLSSHAAITGYGRIEVEDWQQGKKLTFTEFADFVLVRLYELDQGDSELVDVGKVAEELLRPVPASWPFDAVQTLGNHALVVPALAMGSVSAAITGEGRLWVERSRHDLRSIVSQYDRHPETIVVVHGNQNQIAVGNQEGVTQSVAERRPVEETET